MTEPAKTSSIYQEDLAYIHDAGFGDTARAAAPVVVEMLRSAGKVQETVVELGCGSGILLAELSRAGHQVMGIDSSSQMLRLARAKAPQAELRCCSLYDAAIPKCAAVLATGEALNYEPPGRSNLQRLPQLIARIYRALADGGFFLFDLILQLPETVDAYQTWRAGEDWAALIDVTPDSDAIMRRILTFRRIGDGYRRQEETHRVRLFRPDDIETAVMSAGFSLEIREGYGQTRLPPGRRLFIAERRPSQGPSE
jgi:SAM-dependent methyltransferase